MTTSTPVLIATDLSAISDPAVARGATHAQAVGAPIVVLHVVPDVFRSHPLLARRGENEVTLSSDFTRRAADLVTEQLRRVAGIGPDDATVVIETGRPEDEIVRIAEEHAASLVVVGAKPHGRTVERIVRYAHAPVLVARAHAATGKLLVATDFSTSSLAALAYGKMLVEKASVDATVLHVMEPPSTLLPSIASPLGSPIVPPDSKTVQELEDLGKATLDGFAETYKMQHSEQVEGDPADTIIARARATNAEMILVGSRGRTGLSRLFLGSTAEKVVRGAPCSVLVAR